MKGKSESDVAQSSPTLSDPMDCSPPGSCIHGIFQAKVLEWGAIAYSAHTHIHTYKNVYMGFLNGIRGKEPVCQCKRQTQVWSLGQEDCLVEGTANHSSILAWRIPSTEEFGGLWSNSHKEWDTTEAMRRFIVEIGSWDFKVLKVWQYTFCKLENQESWWCNEVQVQRLGALMSKDRRW